MFGIMEGLGDRVFMRLIHPVSTPQNEEPEQLKKQQILILQAIAKYSKRNESFSKYVKAAEKKMMGDIIIPAQKQIAGYYSPLYIEFTAQLYAYYAAVPNDVKLEREKIIRNYCQNFFFTDTFADAVGTYLNDICFSVPSEFLECYVRNICESINTDLITNVYINVNDCQSGLFKRPGVTKYATNEIEERKNVLAWASAQYDDEITAIVGTDDSTDARIDFVRNFILWGICLSKPEALKLMGMGATQYRKYDRFARFINSRYNFNTIVAYHKPLYFTGKLYSLYCEESGNIDLEKELAAIKRNFEDTSYTEMQTGLTPSIVGSLQSNLFEGATIDASRKAFLSFSNSQTMANQKFLKLVEKTLNEGKYTEESLYDSIEQQEHAENLNAGQNDEKSNTAGDAKLMQAACESDALLEDILEEAAALQQPDVTSGDNDEQKINVQSDMPKPPAKAKSASPPKAKKAALKFTQNKTYASPNKNKKKKKKKKKTENDNKTQNEPTTPSSGEDILVSVGVLRGINFRIEELNGLITRLKSKKSSDDNSDNELSELRINAEKLLGILNEETETGGWELSDINRKLLTCDKFLYDAGVFLQSLRTEKGALAKFDRALWNLIEKEPLTTGKDWGGTIATSFNGNFERLEALYHGRCLKPGKTVTIDGETRNLNADETLVFYVTVYSTTDAIRHCMSIKLWKLRDLDDVGPRHNARAYYVGDLVKPTERIDPKFWRLTGKNMAVLHVK